MNGLSPPPAPGIRDLRLDLLRGLAIVFMVSNHLAAGSYLNAITQGHAYASAAEAFVFLSGLVLGRVSHARAQRLGAKEAGRKLLGRAFTLYKTGLVLTLTAGFFALLLPGVTAPLFEAAPGPWWRLTVAALTFHLAPPIVDVLQLYVLCLLLSPLVLLLLCRGLWAPLLTASFGAWLLQQLHPYALSVDVLDRGHPFFVFSAWQLLYVVAFVCGYHHKVLQAGWDQTPAVPRTLFFAGLLAVSLVLAHLDLQRGLFPATFTWKLRWNLWTDRSTLGPIRLLTLLGLFPTVYQAVHVAWKPLYKAVGPALLSLGQHSLYVYVAHVPLVVLWNHLGEWPFQHALAATVGQLAVLALLWFMIKKQVLFKIIPR